jgi:hypothetical protein
MMYIPQLVCSMPPVLAGWHLSHNWLRLAGSESYSLGTDHRKHSFRQFSYCCVCKLGWGHVMLLSHCLVTGVLEELFPSNGCLCWLHNSGFQQTCHNMNFYNLNICNSQNCIGSMPHRQNYYKNAIPAQNCMWNVAGFKLVILTTFKNKGVVFWQQEWITSHHS